jgi:hypothetical protein
VKLLESAIRIGIGIIVVVAIAGVAFFKWSSQVAFEERQAELALIAQQEYLMKRTLDLIESARDRLPPGEADRLKARLLNSFTYKDELELRELEERYKRYGTVSNPRR